MEHLLKQKRVRFSAPEQERSSSAKEKNWFQNQFFRQMNWYYDSEFVAAVAAAAFAICSKEEAEADYKRQIREEFEKAKPEIRTRNGGSSVGSIRASRHSSGEASIRKPAQEDKRVQESAATPSRKPSRSASIRPVVSVDQRQRSTSTRRDAVEDKIDSWEKAQLRKINKRYEKMKAEVLAWENAKKIEAKMHMERKKNELELRKSRNLQYYQIKVERIEAVAGGAKGQLEEKRRSEESEVKEKARNMRLKGKNPVRCFCC
ncbi:remorin 1.4 isoform X2 [Ricinus communis]|uniref:remorin 1.4 isoform X2 n=1 Tax=Ricinus communis TaxID=3988 RepID=UPI00077288CD|nr:remorin 1.4 isoform X2 [Ricinus communis]|eukprot:XP_015571992.1 remorin isoform X2 [Ricinus communis]